jgi:O-acetyl-ADP-ribose deacetylase (regulator of RNase III)
MKIQLVDRNEEMCNQWKLQFKDCKDVIVHCGDFFSLKTDCVVSPANSFGYMDGGLDVIISEKIGWQVQDKLQVQIIENYYGELLVGQALLIETDFDEIPFCIAAPTMRVPSLIENTVNVYLATKAILQLLKKDNRIKTVTISGLGTGVGKMAFDICAKQMKKAYDDVWLGQLTFPNTWHEAQEKHESMCPVASKIIKQNDGSVKKKFFGWG